MTLISGIANITPQQAATRRNASKREIIEILSVVAMPYSLEISKQLKAAHPDYPAKHIGFALRHITDSERYLKATVEADHRTGLDGEVSELLEKHKAYAIERLEQIRSKRSKEPTPVIAPPAPPKATQQERGQSAGKFGKTLSLKKRQ